MHGANAGCKGTGIPITQCAAACSAANESCAGFHTYLDDNDCTTGDCWLHSSPLGTFTSHTGSYGYTKQHAPTAPTAPATPPPPKCLGSHTLRLDAAGKLETWLPAKTAHHDFLTSAMNFLDCVPVEPTTGQSATNHNQNAAKIWI